jgi:xanthine dehydrogenase accessory factor
MQDVLADIVDWWDSGVTFGVATVVDTRRSAPRRPGAAMAVGPDGSVIGSVTGGCIEGAVYDLAREVVETGTPVVQTYGVSEDMAWGMGLTCGGAVDVFVEPVSRNTFPELREVVEAVRAQDPIAVATLVQGNGQLPGARLVVRPDGVGGTLGNRYLDARVASDAKEMLARGQTGSKRYEPRPAEGFAGARVFIAAYAPPPRLLVFGAIDFARAVTRIGKELGYRVTVCDARPLFATPERFPEADEVVVDWPHRFLGTTAVDDSTSICVLTHDPKFDLPLLETALRLPVAYVGAMGSRATHEARMRGLAQAGLTDAELARLSSPIGLDLKAGTPAETAISIAAEMIALARGGSGRRLTETTGPVHAAAPRADDTWRPIDCGTRLAGPFEQPVT